MLMYLLKSTACLALFLAFYKVFLENEQMHVFKRFYLMAIIILSVSIPIIVFTEYIEIQKPITTNMAYSTQPDLEKSNRVTTPNKPFNWSVIAWGFYGLGLLVFGAKFLRNIIQIYHRINFNTKVRTKSNIKVLLEKPTVPHTFFHYIFLNKKKYLDRQIPVSVLLHEETHAHQKHSVDVLLVELLQVLFWFNPCIYVLKHCIKLNHEFLADQAVLQEGANPSDYQKTILHYSSIHRPSLANAINYSSIKKRFTVMKKQTSRTAILFRSLLIVPLLTLMLYGFSQKNVEEFVIEKDTETIKDINIELTNNGHLMDSSTKELRKTGVKKIPVFNDLYSIPEADYPQKIEITPDTILLKTNKTILHSIETSEYNALAKKYNAVPIEKRIIPLEDLRILGTIYGEMTDEQKQNAQPFPECLPQAQKKTNTIKIAINTNGKLLVGPEIVELQDLKQHLAQINKHLTFKQRQQVIRAIIRVDTKTPKEVIKKVDKILMEYGVATIDLVGRGSKTYVPVQEGVTTKQLKEYNMLAKKYNDMDRNHMHLKQREVERLKELYSLMSLQQRADAEPYPDLPAPPPAPESPKGPNTADHANKAIEEIIETQDPYDVVGGNISVTRPPLPETSLAPASFKDIEPSSPPPPPTPKSPLEQLEEMAQKGATFIHNGKEITAENAMEIVKKPNQINIDIRGASGKRPIVKLTTKPIEPEN